MRLLILALAFSCALTAQYVRRSTLPTGKAHDSTGGMIVTFHGKLTELSKKDFTIATDEAHPQVYETRVGVPAGHQRFRASVARKPA